MTPILLLHGFTGTASSFEGIRAALPAGSPVLAPALVGHGTPPTAMHVTTFEGEVDRLEALLPASGPALVVGYSLGARLAFGLLARHPRRVRGLVAISGSTGLPSEEERTARRRHDEALAALLEREGLEVFLRHWEAQPLFDTQRALPEAIRAAERARRASHTAQGLAHSLRSTGLAQMPDYRDALSAREHPVELVCGASDARFCGLANAVAARLRRAQVTRVPGAGHNPLIEAPQAVEQCIRRVLSA